MISDPPTFVLIGLGLALVAMFAVGSCGARSDSKGNCHTDCHQKFFPHPAKHRRT